MNEKVSQFEKVAWAFISFGILVGLKDEMCEAEIAIQQLCRSKEQKIKTKNNKPKKNWAVVVAQLAQQVPPITRGPWFESSHRQNFKMNILTKDKIQKKRPGMAH